MSEHNTPSTLKRGYTYTMLGFLGVFFILGGVNELVANFAPHWMPETIRTALEQSGYELLHAHPIVKWWTRIHNMVNVLMGLSLLAALPGLMGRRRKCWKITLGVLGYLVGAGVVGSLIIFMFLFPTLDTLADSLPVSPDGMKFAMIMGPFALVFVGMLKGRFLWRWSAYYSER